MNADQLLAFVTVVEKNSFTRAAARLGVSQPTVTARVKSLEKELGCRLLERLPNEIRLSEAGTELLPIAQQILRLVARASAITGEDGGVRGKLTMGASDLVTTTRLLPLVEYIWHRYPDLELLLVETSSSHALDGVQAGTLDCAIIVDSLCDRPGLSTVVLREEPLAVVRSPGQGEGGTRESGAALEESLWIRCGQGSDWQADLERSLAEGPGTEASRSISLTSVDGAKRTVAQGLGFTILPAVAAEAELRDGTLVRGRWDSPVSTYLQLAWPDGALTASAPLRAVLRDVCRLFEVAEPTEPAQSGEGADRTVLTEPTPQAEPTAQAEPAP